MRSVARSRCRRDAWRVRCLLSSCLCSSPVNRRAPQVSHFVPSPSTARAASAPARGSSGGCAGPAPPAHTRRVPSPRRALRAPLARSARALAAAVVRATAAKVAMETAAAAAAAKVARAVAAAVAAASSTAPCWGQVGRSRPTPVHRLSCSRTCGSFCRQGCGRSCAHRARPKGTSRR